MGDSWLEMSLQGELIICIVSLKSARPFSICFSFFLSFFSGYKNNVYFENFKNFRNKARWNEKDPGNPPGMTTVNSLGPVFHSYTHIGVWNELRSVRERTVF